MLRRCGRVLFWLEQGRGTVVTGRVEQGIVRTGDEVEILGLQAPTKTIVTGTRPRPALAMLPMKRHIMPAMMRLMLCA